ncbi:hypothetical protein MM213_17650 [Belliella sp. R4-6]|uniref:Uncharacterized protein n=1 Tax=Belliella alkalica TaxID=1730871 RepID=A0ABS9VH93_9BACT|nr:hypothetical protein [Belliella alkalica]MCH7415330.1 hypothetical protein [Belliella alkalica]
MRKITLLLSSFLLYSSVFSQIKTGQVTSSEIPTKRMVSNNNHFELRFENKAKINKELEQEILTEKQDLAPAI